MLTLRLWSLFIWLVPLAFLALKYIQIRSERRLAGLSQVAPLSELFSRRLDDPSFWAVFASACAALLIIRGVQVLGHEPREWANGADTRRFQNWGLWVAIVLASGYLIMTGLKAEAIFSFFGRTNSKDTIILTIQFLEGVLNLSVIWIMTRFFVMALIGIEEAVRRVSIEKDRVKKAATFLASAGIFPFSMFLFAPITYQVLTWVFGFKPDFTKPWPFWIGMIALLPMGVPFGIVAFRAIWKMKKYFRPSLNILAMLHVVIWATMFAMGLADYKPPRTIVAADNPIGIAIGLLGMFVLATPLALWVDFE